MGWQDRDWAKWTDAERANFLGAAPAPAPARRRIAGATVGRRSELALLAILVSAAGSFAVSHFRLYSRLAPASPPPAYAPILYGTGLAHLNGDPQAMTCTALARNADGSQSCTTWSYLQTGQRAAQAATLPPGTDCAAVTADQQTGRWVCTAP